MNRRTFIRSAVAAGTAALLPAIPALAAPQPFSPHEEIDAATWWEKYWGRRIFLDGKDMTEDCCLSNPGEGWVKCWAKNRDGSYAIHEGFHIANHYIGVVEIR
jgi:hypothetical protein